MSDEDTLRTLARVATLRDLEVERLSTQVSDKRVLLGRFSRNLGRLEQLVEGSGASGSPAFAARGTSLSVALALNCGGYKQTVLKIAAAHRVDLRLHEADMAVTQRALSEAVRRQEALDLLVEQKREQVRRGQEARERKRHDDIATQAWSRARK
jgi:flagellar export protein FliJ